MYRSTIMTIVVFSHFEMLLSSGKKRMPSHFADVFVPWVLLLSQFFSDDS